MDILPLSLSTAPHQVLAAPHATSLRGGEVSMRDVAAEFEGVLVSMLLKEMRSTLEEGMFGDDKSDSFGGLFDLTMGQHLADRGGLGIKDLVNARYNQQVTM